MNKDNSREDSSKISAVKKLKENLAKYPHVTFKEKDGFFTIPAISEDGFSISISEDSEECTVFFEGWHEHFTDRDEAVRCVMFGLSDRCRIEVSEVGGNGYRWTLQAFENGSRISYGRTSYQKR